MERRTVLKAGAALALTGAVGVPGRATPARAAAADLDRILANFVAVYTGTPADRSNANVARKVATIGTNAAARLRIMADPATLATTATQLFTGVVLGTAEASLTTTFSHLADIALATVTSGAPQYGDAALQRRVVAGIDWVHRAWYRDQARGYYGNWFHWEIGQPTQLTRALALLGADTVAAYDATLLQRLVATMDAYLRHGIGGDVDLNSRFHTGANLADITHNRIVQGALLGDEARVVKAVRDQATVFATIDPTNIVHGNTDGYYADGSFIQHHTVAYTGSYGKILLGRVVLSVKTLDRTPFAAPALLPTVRGWVIDGFAPVIYEGYMMEAVKGRGVSRTTTGYTDVVGVIEAAVDLSRYLTGTQASEMLGYAKYLATAGRATVNPVSFVSPATIVTYDAALADAAVRPANLLPASTHVTFNAMERDVHLRPGYAFTLARSSSRISLYEYMSGENLKPWFQGLGTSYLYLAGEDQNAAFGCDHFAVVDAGALASVTAPVERRLTVPEAYGRAWYENPDHPLGFTSSSVSQNQYVYFPLGTNDYSAGVRMDTFGMAALVLADDVAWRDLAAGVLPSDFVAYPNARGHKAWFMFDDEVVVLGAGVGDARRDAASVLDTRTVPPSDAPALGGEGVEGLAAEVAGRLPWARWSNQASGASVGYVVLAGPRASASTGVVDAPRASVRTANTGTASRHVSTLRFVHPAGSTSAFAYAVLPGATQTSVTGWADAPAVRVLRNDPTVQAVEHPGLAMKAWAFYGAAKEGRVTATGPLAVMMRELDHGRLRVAFSDPVRTQSELTVSVQGRLRKVGGDAGVAVSFARGVTRLSVRPTDGIGRTYVVDLSPGNS